MLDAGHKVASLLPGSQKRGEGRHFSPELRLQRRLEKSGKPLDCLWPAEVSHVKPKLADNVINIVDVWTRQNAGGIPGVDVYLPGGQKQNI